ncbi:DUF979 domain-containing protein [Coralloluteibacterium thermophilus]|uniref:DUF979 domain-containing protein n=1 Tax=Coralloluteibacterium thermophilum TaxID=2707049 RepID=A0ABV9NNR5_9GAMM
MITLGLIYWITGAYLALIAWRTLRDRGNPRRFAGGLFWGLLALVTAVGERLPPLWVGIVVVVLAGIAGLGGLRRGSVAEAPPARRAADAARLGNRLFWPALAIPLVTLLLAVVLDEAEVFGLRLLGGPQPTLIALAVACLVGTAMACMLTRSSPLRAVEDSRRLLDAIGWAALLPLLLATLGSVFAGAGVGETVAGMTAAVVPPESRVAALAAFALGMVVFTVIMGNAFAAFPVMMAGIGLPLLVHGHGADAAPLAALGMLSGYCGTLLTPMAANFNLVPAALLELPPYAVIRAQVATALPLLACNVVLMYIFVFR